MSEVSQVTVIAAVLFVIIISDIDENIKKCTVRSLSDNIKVSKKVICNKDKKINARPEIHI